jgi:8-oxo-dGTP pyrophosphatase MutT (NUDIX family)
MERHFTVTGFVIDGDRALLHWHKKIGLWLPPGGHIDPDEDPVQAVLREVLEETGITGEIVPHRSPLAYTNVQKLATPYEMIVADVMHGGETHQHIDMSYIVRPKPGAARREPEADHGFRWVSEAELRRNDPLPVAGCGTDVCVPEDVREIALAAFALARNQPSTGG